MTARIREFLRDRHANANDHGPCLVVDLDVVRDNYQNFAKAFRVQAYDDLMGNMEPNKAKLKTAEQFKKAGFEIKEFGPSKSRALLYAIYEVERDVDGDEALSHLRDQVDGYFNAREDLMALAEYIAVKREKVDDEEARAARIVHGLIRNERFG